MPSFLSHHCQKLCLTIIEVRSSNYFTCEQSNIAPLFDHLSCASCRSTRWSALTLLSPLEVNKTYHPPTPTCPWLFCFYLYISWFIFVLTLSSLLEVGEQDLPTPWAFGFFIFVFVFLVVFVPFAVLVLCFVLCRL